MRVTVNYFKYCKQANQAGRDARFTLGLRWNLSAFIIDNFNDLVKISSTDLLKFFNIRLQDNFPIDMNNISWAVNEHDFSESVKQF